jgi:hypothetical protein
MANIGERRRLRLNAVHWARGCQLDRSTRSGIGSERVRLGC